MRDLDDDKAHRITDYIELIVVWVALFLMTLWFILVLVIGKDDSGEWKLGITVNPTKERK